MKKFIKIDENGVEILGDKMFYTMKKQEILEKSEYMAVIGALVTTFLNENEIKVLVSALELPKEIWKDNKKFDKFMKKVSKEGK